ncbi:MAG: recombinase XerD, partial [Planctomycetota bacterium]
MPEGAGDPHGLFAWMQRYLEWLRVKNYSERTVENREAYLLAFLGWCTERGITRPVEVTRPIL